MTLDDARELSAAAARHAVTLGKPITVAIVDTGGFTVLVERMDGARPLTPSIALAKAYTAAVMQRPTAMLRGWADSNPGFFAQVSRLGHHPIVAAEGGVTLKRDGVILGGVGISGGTGAEDQELCEQALAELGYELDFDAFNRIRH